MDQSSGTRAPTGSLPTEVGERPGNQSPASNTLAGASSAPRRFPAPSTREESDDYQAVVAVLNSRWRVIECRDGIQWIVQRRRGHRDGLPVWRGESFCRTKSALLQCIREKCGDVDLGVVALPDHFRASDELSVTEAVGHSGDGLLVK